MEIKKFTTALDKTLSYLISAGGGSLMQWLFPIDATPTFIVESPNMAEEIENDAIMIG
jgi:hypothetical protein